MKRILILLTTALLLFAIVACSGKKSEQPAGEQQAGSQHVSSNEDTSSGEKDDKVDSKNENTKKSDKGKKIDISKANTGLINEDEIPVSYRKDLVPIVPNSEIYSGTVSGDETNPHINLVCLSEEKLEEILEFYREVMKNADEKREMIPDSDGCILDGYIDNMLCTIIIKREFGKELGGSFDIKFKTSVFIELQIYTDKQMEEIKQGWG